MTHTKYTVDFFLHEPIHFCNFACSVVGSMNNAMKERKKKTSEGRSSEEKITLVTNLEVGDILLARVSGKGLVLFLNQTMNILLPYVDCIMKKSSIHSYLSFHKYMYLNRDMFQD